jgi:hypothetical protein
MDLCRTSCVSRHDVVALEVITAHAQATGSVKLTQVFLQTRIESIESMCIDDDSAVDVATHSPTADLNSSSVVVLEMVSFVLFEEAATLDNPLLYILLVGVEVKWESSQFGNLLGASEGRNSQRSRPNTKSMSVKVDILNAKAIVRTYAIIPSIGAFN